MTSNRILNGSPPPIVFTGYELIPLTFPLVQWIPDSVLVYLYFTFRRIFSKALRLRVPWRWRGLLRTSGEVACIFPRLKSCFWMELTENVLTCFAIPLSYCYVVNDFLALDKQLCRRVV